ncbi:MAG: hypothetical protein AB1750_18055, partial [Chloroflexota bacterium]
CGGRQLETVPTSAKSPFGDWLQPAKAGFASVAAISIAGSPTNLGRTDFVKQLKAALKDL